MPDVFDVPQIPRHHATVPVFQNRLEYPCINCGMLIDIPFIFRPDVKIVFGDMKLKVVLMRPGDQVGQILGIDGAGFPLTGIVSDQLDVCLPTDTIHPAADGTQVENCIFHFVPRSFFHAAVLVDDQLDVRGMFRGDAEGLDDIFGDLSIQMLELCRGFFIPNLFPGHLPICAGFGFFPCAVWVHRLVHDVHPQDVFVTIITLAQGGHELFQVLFQFFSGSVVGLGPR